MISTAITRLFTLPNSPSGSNSVDVNTETGHKFIAGTKNAGPRLSALPSRPISSTPLGDASRDASNDFGRARVSPAAGF
jgi:hypothetical protein